MFRGVSGTPVTNNFKKDNLQQALITYGVWGWLGPGYRVTPFKVILYSVYKYVRKPSRVVGFHIWLLQRHIQCWLPFHTPTLPLVPQLIYPFLSHQSLSPFSPPTLYSSREVFSGFCGYPNLNTLIKKFESGIHIGKRTCDSCFFGSGLPLVGTYF